jgi:hypothetical protein
MVSKNHIRLSDLAPYLRGYDSKSPELPEDWAKVQSAGFKPGMLLFCLEKVAQAAGLAVGRRDDAGEHYRVKDLCIVVGDKDGRPVVINVTSSAFELRYLEVLMSEKAKKAILDEKDFYFVAARPVQPLTDARREEIEDIAMNYTEGGSRRTLVVDPSGPPEPAMALLSALGARVVVPGIGKQALDIGYFCHLLFAPEGRQEDKNKPIVKTAFAPLSNAELAAAPKPAPETVWREPGPGNIERPRPVVPQPVESTPAESLSTDWQLPGAVQADMAPALVGAPDAPAPPRSESGASGTKWTEPWTSSSEITAIQPEMKAEPKAESPGQSLEQWQKPVDHGSQGVEGLGPDGLSWQTPATVTTEHWQADSSKPAGPGWQTPAEPEAESLGWQVPDFTNIASGAENNQTEFKEQISHETEFEHHLKEQFEGQTPPKGALAAPVQALSGGESVAESSGMPKRDANLFNRLYQQLAKGSPAPSAETTSPANPSQIGETLPEAQLNPAPVTAVRAPQSPTASATRLPALDAQGLTAGAALAASPSSPPVPASPPVSAPPAVLPKTDLAPTPSSTGAGSISAKFPNETVSPPTFPAFEWAKAAGEGEVPVVPAQPAQDQSTPSATTPRPGAEGIPPGMRARDLRATADPQRSSSSNVKPVPNPLGEKAKTAGNPVVNLSANEIAALNLPTDLSGLRETGKIKITPDAIRGAVKRMQGDNPPAAGAQTGQSPDRSLEGANKVGTASGSQINAITAGVADLASGGAAQTTSAAISASAVGSLASTPFQSAATPSAASTGTGSGSKFAAVRLPDSSKPSPVEREPVESNQPIPFTDATLKELPKIIPGGGRAAADLTSKPSIDATLTELPKAVAPEAKSGTSSGSNISTVTTASASAGEAQAPDTVSSAAPDAPPAEPPTGATKTSAVLPAANAAPEPVQPDVPPAQDAVPASAGAQPTQTAEEEADPYKHLAEALSGLMSEDDELAADSYDVSPVAGAPAESAETLIAEKSVLAPAEEPSFDLDLDDDDPGSIRSSESGSGPIDTAFSVVDSQYHMPVFEEPAVRDTVSDAAVQSVEPVPASGSIDLSTDFLVTSGTDIPALTDAKADQLSERSGQRAARDEADRADKSPDAPSAASPTTAAPTANPAAVSSSTASAANTARTVPTTVNSAAPGGGAESSPPPGVKPASEFQEPRLVMNEMVTLMNKLEQQVAKAAKKIGSRAEEIKQNLNQKMEQLLHELSQVENQNQAVVQELTVSLSQSLDAKTDESREAISETAADGRYTIKQLLTANQQAIDDTQNTLYDDLKQACENFRSESEKLTQECETALQNQVKLKTDGLESVLIEIYQRLDDTTSSFVSKIDQRFARFKERMEDESTAIAHSLERNVHSMFEEIDGSWDRAGEKLKLSKNEFEQTINHSVKTVELGASQNTRHILINSMAPQLREHTRKLQDLKDELTKQFMAETAGKSSLQLQGLDMSLAAARQQLHTLVTDCVSSLDSVGRGQQAGLEEIFKAASTKTEKLITEAQAGILEAQSRVQETEDICKRLAETSSIDADSVLMDEKNTTTSALQQIKTQCNSQIQTALEDACMRLERMSQNMQTEVANNRIQQTLDLRELSENGLASIREALQDAKDAVQAAREQHME